MKRNNQLIEQSCKDALAIVYTTELVKIAVFDTIRPGLVTLKCGSRSVTFYYRKNSVHQIRIEIFDTNMSTDIRPSLDAGLLIFKMLQNASVETIEVNHKSNPLNVKTIKFTYKPIVYALVYMLLVPILIFMALQGY